MRAALGANALREGPRGSIWAAHLDAEGVVTGWEERGRTGPGFATGGAKVLFRLGGPKRFASASPRRRSTP
ncbi:DUF3991 domain-containing protein [Neomesorhizobium albiziae]|uniref:DUF3991 domain-containing protein n=1 Tax=Neomesorhizobium albiziae TaxID=335020 RepID=UPI001FCE9BA0|nr:DUF3991 domain-containing protein [Mesorhizobium albiziae]